MSHDGAIRPRILRALGAEALGQFLNIALRLLLVPLFLFAWGAHVYGEWLILTATAAWFGMGDLGGQMYFANRVTVAWAANRMDEFQRVLSTGFVLLFVTSGVLFTGIVLALMWPPFLGWLGLETLEPGVARIVLLMMAVRFLIALPTGLLLAVYRAMGAQATSFMYANLAVAIQFVGSALALTAGSGMVVLAALEVLPFLVVTAIVIRDLRRRLPPDVKLLSPDHFDGAVLRAAISPSLHFLGVQLAQAFMIQGSTIAVGKALGPVEVAIFSTTRTISNTVARFPAMLSHAAWPEVTRLESTGHTAKLGYLLRLTLYSSLLGGVVYLAGVHSFGDVLFQRWLHGTLPYDPTVTFLMGCFVLLTSLWSLGGNVLMATTQHEEYARLQFAVSILALVLLYRGAVAYGLTGAVLGLIAGQSISMLAIVIWLLVRKNLNVAAAALLQVSVGAVILIPMCLNPWSGLAGIAAIAFLTARQLRIGVPGQLISSWTEYL